MKLDAEIGKPINEVSETEEENNNWSPQIASKVPVTFGKLLLVPLFVFGLLAQIIIYGSVAFFGPVMSLHLLTYEGFDEFWVGIYFGVPAIIYILNTPLVSFYCKAFTRRGVVWVGMCIFCTSIFLIGTSPALGIPDST